MVKCLTICQPWAWAILEAGKRVENRTWATRHRGLLLLHAGKSEKFLGGFSSLQIGLEPPKHEMVFGAIVGVCTLVACLPRQGLTFGQMTAAGFNEEAARRQRVYVEGPFCWVLSNVRRFVEPVPYTGAQGLFDVPWGCVGAELPRAEVVA